MLLVKYDDNWSDEMDICGFKIMDNDQYSQFMDSVNFGEYPYIHYIGTNEEIYYELPRDFKRTLCTITITPEQLDVLTYALTLGEDKEYGFFPLGPGLPELYPKMSKIGHAVQCSVCHKFVPGYDLTHYDEDGEVRDIRHVGSHYHEGKLCHGAHLEAE
jgi:hypothetical protein